MPPASQLGPLEQAIMEIVWTKHEVTVRTVVTQLKSHKEVAYTTVMTIMSRLVKKGFLEHTTQGKTYVYRPKQNQEETLKTLVKRTLQSFVNRFGDEAVAAFLDEADALTQHQSVTNRTSK